MDEVNENKDVIKKKKKWIIPVIIGVVLAATIAVAVIVIISATAPSRALKNQLDLGNKYLGNLDYENAILAYEEAIRINPKAAESYLGLADIYLALGAEKEKEKDYQEAMTYYKKALEVLERGKAGAEEKELIIAKLAEIQNRINTLSENEILGDEEDQKNVALDLENLWVVTSYLEYNGNKEDGEITWDYSFGDDGVWVIKNYIKSDWGYSDRLYYNKQGYCIKEISYDKSGTLSSTCIHEFDENNHLIKMTAYDSNGKMTGWTEWTWSDSDIMANHADIYDADGKLIDNTILYHYYQRIGETEEEYKKLDNDHLGSYKQYFQDEKTLITEYTDGRKTIEHYEKLRDVCR